MTYFERTIFDIARLVRKDEIEAALDYAVTLPDICVAATVEAAGGNPKYGSIGERYVEWAEKHIGELNKAPDALVHEPYLSGKVLWRLRNCLKHNREPLVIFDAAKTKNGDGNSEAAQTECGMEENTKFNIDFSLTSVGCRAMIPHSAVSCNEFSFSAIYAIGWLVSSAWVYYNGCGDGVRAKFHVVPNSDTHDYCARNLCEDTPAAVEREVEFLRWLMGGGHLQSGYSSI